MHLYWNEPQCILWYKCIYVRAVKNGIWCMHCGRKYLNWCTPFWPYSQCIELREPPKISVGVFVSNKGAVCGQSATAVDRFFKFTTMNISHNYVTWCFNILDWIWFNLFDPNLNEVEFGSTWITPFISQFVTQGEYITLALKPGSKRFGALGSMCTGFYFNAIQFRPFCRGRACILLRKLNCSWYGLSYQVLHNLL